MSVVVSDEICCKMSVGFVDGKGVVEVVGFDVLGLGERDGL